LSPFKTYFDIISNLIFGKDAKHSEKLLGLISSLVIPSFLLFLILEEKVHWSSIQILIALEMGLDLGGGMIINMMGSCRNFYHSPILKEDPWIVRTLKRPLLFISLHIYPILVYVFFDSTNLIYGFIWYGILLISALLILKSPKLIQRPLSILIVLLVIMINSFVITPVYGFVWLIPVLFIKLIVGHLA
jgi:hypothetical protein